MAKTNPNPPSLLEVLLTTVSDGPDISWEFGELRAAIDRVSMLQRKAREVHSTDYNGAIRRARDVLNSTAAKLAIDRATAEQLEAAKATHAAAVEALDLAPGQMAVFQAEINVASETLSEKLEELTQKLGPWRYAVGVASERVIGAGLALILAGLQARALQNPMGEPAPYDLHYLISMTGIHPGDEHIHAEHPVPVSENITTAHELIRETERKLDALAAYDPRAESMKQLREADIASGFDRDEQVKRASQTPYSVDDNTAHGALSSLYQVGAQSSRPD